MGSVVPRGKRHLTPLSATRRAGYLVGLVCLEDRVVPAKAQK